MSIDGLDQNGEVVNISTSWEWVDRRKGASIVAVTYGGYYAPGSAGNPFANAMRDFLRVVVADTRPSAVLIDLTGVNYSFGDAIVTLALVLWQPTGRFLPAAIVAVGNTARALTPLLKPG